MSVSAMQSLRLRGQSGKSVYKVSGERGLSLEGRPGEPSTEGWWPRSGEIKIGGRQAGGGTGGSRLRQPLQGGGGKQP